MADAPTRERAMIGSLLLVSSSMDEDASKKETEKTKETDGHELRDVLPNDVPKR